VAYLEVVRKFELNAAKFLAVVSGVVGWRRRTRDIGVDAVEDGVERGP